MLENKVPPAPLDSVTPFAAAVAKFEKQACLSETVPQVSSVSGCR